MMLLPIHEACLSRKDQGRCTGGRCRWRRVTFTIHVGGLGGKLRCHTALYEFYSTGFFFFLRFTRTTSTSATAGTSC